MSDVAMVSPRGTRVVVPDRMVAGLSGRGYTRASEVDSPDAENRSSAGRPPRPQTRRG